MRALVGLLEALRAGYLAIGYEDVVLFALLAVLRPRGLLGQPVRLANDQFRPPGLTGAGPRR